MDSILLQKESLDTTTTELRGDSQSDTFSEDGVVNTQNHAGTIARGWVQDVKNCEFFFFSCLTVCMSGIV